MTTTRMHLQHDDAQNVSFVVVPYTCEHFDMWESLVTESHTATFLHSQRYISYHGSRFDDRSVLLLDETSHAVAAFPAAVDPTDPTVVTSHPGLTYGGLITRAYLRGKPLHKAMQTLITHYRNLGLYRLRYKAVPWIYHRYPCQDDLYALFLTGASLYRRDISSTIDLSAPRTPTRRRMRSLAHARKTGISFQRGSALSAIFWPILEQSLRERHGASPVHSLAEISLLQSRFPERVIPICAYHNNSIVAGAVLYNTNTVCHIQYIAATREGLQLSATDALIEHCIEIARSEMRQYFDFGISTEAAGHTLNASLYDYKTSFGAGSCVHDFYEIDLHAQAGA